MRLTWLAFSAVILCPASGASAQTPIRFADVPWGAPSSVAKAQVRASGFTLDSVDKDGDLTFHGTVVGRKAIGVILFTPDGKTVKARVSIVTPDDEARQVYATTVEALSRKYGEPYGNLEEFEYPYEKDDGHEETAIKMGKATIATLWRSPTDEGGTGVAVQISKQLNVEIIYEGPGWKGEADRRSDQSLKAF
jgi:hypothetical protein